MNNILFVLYGTIFLCICYIITTYRKDHGLDKKKNYNQPQKWKENFQNDTNTTNTNNSSNFLKKAVSATQAILEQVNAQIGLGGDNNGAYNNRNKPSANEVKVQESMESFLMGNKAHFIENLNNIKNNTIVQNTPIKSVDLDDYLGATRNSNPIVELL